MMKKYSLIAALVIALTFAFVGCSGTLPGDDDDGDRTGSGELKDKVVFDLSTHAAIQALDDGHEFDLSVEANKVPLRPLQEATDNGNAASIKIVEVDGKKALEVETTAGVSGWGPGIDLPFRSFGFREGDSITIKGKVVGAFGAVTTGSTARVQLNSKGSKGENAIKNTTEGDKAFDWELILTAAQAAEIKADSMLRIEIRAKATTIQLYEIKVSGKRPTEITKNEAPVVKVNGTVVSWEAVDGAGSYRVYEGDNLITTVSTTSLDLLSIATLAEGDYNITVVAVGIDGESTDSDKSAVVKATRQYPQVKITLGTAEVSVGIRAAGDAKVESSGTYFTYTAGTGGYGNNYAYFDLKLPEGKNLSDYTKISFVYWGREGDGGGKNPRVLADVVSGITGGWIGADSNHETVGSGKRISTYENSSSGFLPAAFNSANSLTNAGRLDDETTVRIAIYIHGGSGMAGDIGVPTKFQVYNIKIEE